jgi:hypothetical protein
MSKLMKFLSSLCGNTTYEVDTLISIAKPISVANPNPNSVYLYTVFFKDEHIISDITFSQLDIIVKSDHNSITRINRTIRGHTIALFFSNKLWWDANKCLDLTINMVTYEEEKIVTFLKSKNSKKIANSK